MQKKSIYDYVWLGTSLRYLQDVQAGYKIHGDSFVIYNIMSLLDNINELGLHVTKRSTYQLEELKKELENTKEEASLTSNQAIRLSEIMEKIRHTMLAEVGGYFAYVTSEKRLDITKLIGSVDKLLPPGVWNKLHEIARHDLQEAGMCIAFERPTAAAFHLLRGVEAVLRIYHAHHFPSLISDRNWGPLIDELRNKTAPNPPDSNLLNHLDHIRNGFRNPTQHPEKIYDIHEVQDLFNLCVDVIGRMAREL